VSVVQVLIQEEEDLTENFHEVEVPDHVAAALNEMEVRSSASQPHVPPALSAGTFTGQGLQAARAAESAAVAVEAVPVVEGTTEATEETPVSAVADSTDSTAEVAIVAGSPGDQARPSDTTPGEP
jgi:hypothetical protein